MPGQSNSGGTHSSGRPGLRYGLKSFSSYHSGDGIGRTIIGLDMTLSLGRIATFVIRYRRLLTTSYAAVLSLGRFGSIFAPLLASLCHHRNIQFSDGGGGSGRPGQVTSEKVSTRSSPWSHGDYGRKGMCGASERLLPRCLNCSWSSELMPICGCG
jgi:hypothetical protein